MNTCINVVQVPVRAIYKIMMMVEVRGCMVRKKMGGGAL